jgi:hypothetical protein
MANDAINAYYGLKLDCVNSVLAVVNSFFEMDWSAAWSHRCVDEAPHMWRGVMFGILHLAHP